MEKVIIIIFLFMGLIYFIYKSNEVRYVQSDYDSNKYVVLNRLDSKEAANILAEIRQNLEKLKRHLEKTYPNKQATKHIRKRFNPNNISEGSPDSQYTSYTVNKVEKMVFCIRDKKTKRLHDVNLLMYVCTHELAHVGCTSTGHNGEFNKTFDFLLNEAEKIGLYKKNDFANQNIQYCGMNL